MKTLLTLIAATLVALSSLSNAYGVTTILTIGDSITAGLKLNGSRNNWYCPADGVRTSSFYSCIGNGVVNLGGYQPIAKQLFAQQGITANLYNWGVNGEESWELLGRINAVMNSRSADAILILGGVNDLNDNVSIQTTAFNIDMMMAAAKARGLTTVVGTITPHLGQASYNPKIVQINALIKDFAAQKKVAVADHYGTFITNWSAYNSGDGLHLSTNGDTAMATNWVQAYIDGGGVSIAPVINLLLD